MKYCLAMGVPRNAPNCPCHCQPLSTSEACGGRVLRSALANRITAWARGASRPSATHARIRPNDRLADDDATRTLRFSRLLSGGPRPGPLKGGMYRPAAPPHNHIRPHKAVFIRLSAPRGPAHACIDVTAGRDVSPPRFRGAFLPLHNPALGPILRTNQEMHGMPKLTVEGVPPVDVPHGKRLVLALED